MLAIRPNRLPLFAAALLIALHLGAQTQQGDILGTIRDPQGAGVPNAEIKITNQTTGAFRTLASNENGDYLALGFFPGVFKVEVTLTGFQKAIVENVRVEPQARVRLDIPPPRRWRRISRLTMRRRTGISPSLSAAFSRSTRTPAKRRRFSELKPRRELNHAGGV